LDKETGLYYYRARYHDPVEGRFISKDPIGFEGGINLYAYVQNNPINWIDPDGLSKTKGIQQGNDEYLRRLRDTKGVRDEIDAIEREIAKKKQCGDFSKDRLNKLKAWLKLAKDGRLFAPILVVLPGQEDLLNNFNNGYGMSDNMNPGDL
jgi:uncharacterized protein RhaS with RHS repeats